MSNGHRVLSKSHLGGSQSRYHTVGTRLGGRYRDELFIASFNILTTKLKVFFSLPLFFDIEDRRLLDQSFSCNTYEIESSKALSYVVDFLGPATLVTQKELQYRAEAEIRLSRTPLVASFPSYSFSRSPSSPADL